MNPIFEGTKVTLRMRLVRGKKRTAGQITITFTQQAGGAARIANATLPFSKKDDEVLHQFIVPRVREDAASYSFDFDAVPTGALLEDLGDRDFTVWPQSIRLEAFTEVGHVQTPCEGFRFRFVRSGFALGETKTLGGGIAAIGCRFTGVHTIQAISPFQIVRWIEQHARLRKVVVSGTYPAEIVSPVWQNAPTENVQYVNLDGPAANEGHRVKVTVGAAGDQGKAAHLQLGKQDDPIYVKVVFNAANSARNDPPPALHIGTTQILPTGNPKTSEGMVKLSADGGTAEFEVELGHAGGDKCEIHVGVTKRCEDQSVLITNWRKLTFEVQVPDFIGWTGLPGAASGFTKTALDPAFIEYAVGATTTFTEGEAPADTVVESDYFNSPRKLHVLGADVPAPKPWSSTDARNIHVRICDKIITPDEFYTMIKVPFDRIHAAADAFILLEMHKKKQRYFPFPKNLEDLGDPVLMDQNDTDSAEWKADVLPSDPRVKSGSLAGWTIVFHSKNAMILRPPPTDPVRRFITTAKDGPGLLTECTVHIKLQMRLFKEVGGTNRAGEQIYPLDDALGLKLSHELGHAMGMAIFPGKETPPPGTPAPKHVDGGGTYYRRPDPMIDSRIVYGVEGLRGPNHKGPHCAHGVGNPAAHDLAGGGGSCIMFGEVVSTTTAYCPQCLQYIKARRLSDVTSTWLGRSPSDA